MSEPLHWTHDGVRVLGYVRNSSQRCDFDLRTIRILHLRQALLRLSAWDFLSIHE